MNLQDLDALAKGLAPVVSRLMADATAPLVARIAALEAIEPKDGAPGRDGKDADEAMVAAAVSTALADLPPVDPGPTMDDVVRTAGELIEAARTPTVDIEGLKAELAQKWDAQDKSLLELTARLSEFSARIEALPQPAFLSAEDLDAAVEKAVSALPTPKDGKDADMAEVERLIVAEVAKIPTPKDGQDIDPEFVAEQIAEAVAAAVEAIPAPRDGKDGQDGRDGVGLAGALIDREGQFVVTLTNGETKALGPVIGRDGAPGANGTDGQDGAPGKDGRDGLEPDSIELGWGDDGRTLTAKYVYGDTAMIIEAAGAPAPSVIYRGVFKDGQAYARGDMVTWAGSLWHCDAETSEKPGDGAKTWTLAAKRGRDGKDGKDGEKGSPGRDGKDGKDITRW